MILDAPVCPLMKSQYPGRDDNMNRCECPITGAYYRNITREACHSEGRCVAAPAYPDVAKAEQHYATLISIHGLRKCKRIA